MVKPLIFGVMLILFCRLLNRHAVQYSSKESCTMKLDYIDNIPFEYVMSDINKDIKLSDKLKMELNHYYIDINKSDNKDIDRWTENAKKLKSQVELEVQEFGNKKSIYVTDYVQFIFGVSYLFFNKFHMTQKEVASILGMTTSKFSKLDIFPYRCYSAFTKLDDKRKPLGTMK